MTNKTSLLRLGLTSVAGLTGAAVAAAAVAVLILVPMPAFTGEAPSTTVNPAPSDQLRVCQGPLVQTIAQGADATTFLSNGSPVVATDSPDSRVMTVDLDAVDNEAPASIGTPSVITVPASEGSEKQPLLAGNVLQLATSEDLAGLATAACAEPGNDMWLVGGATDVGRTTLIMLSNPTTVTASVTFEIYSENGYIESVNDSGVIVEPGQQRIISLAGYAPDVVSPVVRVLSKGGQVLATMQQSVTRTLQPSGVEFINPSAMPNTTQIIPGVYLTGHAEHDDTEHGAIMSDMESAIRVLVPGMDEAKITLQVISSTGESTEIESELAGQHTVQLPFVGIEDGTYTVVVSADKPILAGVRTVFDGVAPVEPVSAGTTPTPGSGGDFAWFTSGNALGDELLMPIPAGPAPTVSFYNPTRSDVTVTISAKGSKDIVLEVASGGMVTSPLAAATNYTATGTTGLIGGLTFSGTGVASAITLNPANQLGSAITVYTR